MNELKEFLLWLGILGIPSIFGMTVWCIRQCLRFTHMFKIMLKAQQAQMRKDLLDDYDYYMSGGWISHEHMKDWENRYQAYHALGKNGVMDYRREELLHLPDHP